MSDSAVATSGHGAAHGKKGLGNPVLGMLLFIVSEIMFFAGLFAAYFSLRTATGTWPPAGNGAFLLHDEVLFPGIMTSLLVLSSITCQIAVWRIRPRWSRCNADTTLRGIARLAYGNVNLDLPSIATIGSVN